MRRYHFLQSQEVFDALNSLRDAFLAAQNGEEVEKIIHGLLTTDEKLKIGRRIIVANALVSQMTFEDISQIHKVGANTILSVARMLEKDNTWHKLIIKRAEKVEKKYEAKKYIESGGSKLIYKKKTYSGFTKKQVNR